MNLLKIIQQGGETYVGCAGKSIFPAFSGEPSFLIDDAMRLVAREGRDGWASCLYSHEAAEYLNAVNSRPDGQSVLESFRRWAINWAVQKIAMDQRVPVTPRQLDVDSDRLRQEVEEYLSRHFQGAA